MNTKILFFAFTITALSGAWLNAGLSQSTFKKFPLHEAVKDNNFENVKKIFEVNKNTNPNHLDQERITPLHYAVYLWLHGNPLDIVAYLLEKGANINATDNKGATVIHYAVGHNQIEKVKYLLEHGAHIDQTNRDGETPLYTACTLDKPAMIEYLLEHGANIDSRCIEGKTPLNAAASRDNFLAIKCLLKHGSNINQRDGHHRRPLDEAASENRFDMVKCLIEHGSNFDVICYEPKDITFNGISVPYDDIFFRNDVPKIKKYIKYAQNYIKKGIVRIKKNQYGKSIELSTIPCYISLALKINNPYDINHFSQVPQFDDNQYLPNLRHYIKTVQVPDNKNDGLVAALWITLAQNPTAKSIKNQAGYKFLTQYNLFKNNEIKKLHDSHFLFV